MVDLEDLRNRPDAYQKAADQKRLKVSVKEFLELDLKRRKLQTETDALRSEQNGVSKKMPSLEKSEKEKVLGEMRKLKKNLSKLEEEMKKVTTQWERMQLDLPSIPLARVPVGKDESGNREVKRWGDPPKFAFTPKDHITLGEELDIVDFDRAAKVGGSRSYFLKGDGARLHHAVLRYAMDKLIEKRWTLFTPPHLATEECFMGTGFFPGADQENIYAVGGKETSDAPIQDDGLYLIGTSEVSVCSYHKGETLTEAELPKRYAGYSVCFRREAGSYGADTKGLYRVHQFEKVEQVVLCRADEAEALSLFEEIRTNAEEVLQALKLPYRVLDICTGDMGKGKLYMQDIETWMPSRDAYGETHSCSYLGDFQARRLGIRYTDREGKRRFVHTLNNTCIASPRILIPLLEIYQQKDGSVEIPQVLRGYLGEKKVIART